MVRSAQGRISIVRVSVAVAVVPCDAVQFILLPRARGNPDGVIRRKS